jgi:hypothetical protein
LQYYNYDIDVTAILFEWDEAKNLSNQRKHGISFEEASQVFLDPLHISVADRVVDGEQRWQTSGMARTVAGSLLLVLVANTIREDLEQGTFIEVVRIIISAKGDPGGEKKL